MLTWVRDMWARMREHERLFMISISTVLVMAGQGVISPVLPLFAAEFGVTTAAIGMTLSIFGIARLVLNVPIGVVSDRYGRRLVLVGGPLVTAVGMIGSGLSGDIYQLLAWRFVAGAGSAMYMTGAQLYLVDISTPANRARFLGTNQGALLFGVSIGPGIGGLIAEALGLAAPFLFVGGAALVAAVYAFYRIPETHHLGREHAPDPAAKRPGTSRRRQALVFALSANFMAVSLVTMAIFSMRTGARGTLMPLLGADRFGMTPGSLGGLFTITAVVGLVLIAPSAMITDRLGRKRAIVPSGLVSAAGLLVMAVSPTPALFFLGAMVLAVGNGIAGPAPAAYAGDIAPPELRGVAMGLFRSAGDVGFVAGPFLLGALADVTSIGWSLIANAGLVAVVTALFAVMARETSGSSVHQAEQEREREPGAD